ncbi:hypothetical protein SLITK23_26280 [Streptomyces lividans]|nr:hypothetical protein SLITK23_26280 [Streptomyces lividans]
MTVEFSSPPTYWIGFCTCGSSASSCGNTDSAAGEASAGISRDLRVLTRGTIQPNPAGPVPLTAHPPGAVPLPPRVPYYADIGLCTVIDWSRPTAIQTANMEEPP